MSDSSRRGFLKVAGAGVAVAGVAVVTPAVGSTGVAATAAQAEPATLPRSAKGSIVAHVHDVHSGEISLLVDGHEVTVTDHDLAARIATALHKNSPRTVNNSAL